MERGHSVNLVFILRSEVVSAAILLYLFFFSLRYLENEQKGRFLQMCICAFGHVVFDFITVCTVNHLDSIPVWINDLLHIIFYEFAILFCYEFFCYVLNNALPYMTAKKIARWVLPLPVLYPLTILFLRIDYLQGRGTIYSYGPAAFLGYGLAMTLFFISFLLVLFGKNLDASFKAVILPMLTLMLAGVITQIFIPELLFTGSAITLAVLGVYFAIENPLNKYRQRAYFDMGTGVRNRNSYEEDLLYLEREYGEKNVKPEIAYVLCDLNDLKKTNDRYGHMEGDELIRQAAHLLTTYLRHAYRIYRIGGDEFVALYLDERLTVVEEEIETVRREGQRLKTTQGVPFSAAIGSASSKDAEMLSEIAKIADTRMYEDKARIKAQK